MSDRGVRLVGQGAEDGGEEEARAKPRRSGRPLSPPGLRRRARGNPDAEGATGVADPEPQMAAGGASAPAGTLLEDPGPTRPAQASGPGRATAPGRATGPGRRGRRRRLAGLAARHPRLVPAGTVLLALAVGAASYFGVAWYNQRNQEANRAAAVTTAEHLMMALTNFDSSTINADFHRISTYATGQFAQQLPPTFGNPKLRKQLEAAHAQSRGQISGVYLKTGDQPNQASAYVVVDQTSQSSKYKGPLVDVVQAKVDLVMTKHGWRVDHLSAINSQSNQGSSPLLGGGGGPQGSSSPSPSTGSTP